MKKKLIITLIFVFIPNTYLYANENDCLNFKKFSINYMKCKANKVKEGTISVGKKIIKDTKDYQKKEWSKEKDKIDKIKEKF